MKEKDKSGEERLRELIEEVIEDFRLEDVDKDQVLRAVFNRIVDSIGKKRELIQRLVEEEINKRKEKRGQRNKRMRQV